MKKFIFILCFINWFTCFTLFAKDSITTKKLEPTEKKVLYNFLVIGDNNIPEDKAIINLIYNGTNKQGISDSKGIYACLLDKGITYKVSVKKFNKIFNFNEITLPENEDLLILEKKLQIKIIYIRIYPLRDVNFLYNKYTLEPKSYKSLNGLVTKMRENSKMIIEIAGHTDDIGNDDFNLKLSQNRVNSIKKYLVEHGIKQDRITAKGYGSYNPVALNNTEVGRQRNRRVEIRVIEE